MATPAASAAWKPPSMGTVSMLLCYKDRQCAEAIKLYELELQSVLGAKQMFPPVTMGDPPLVTHITMQVGECTIMMHDYYEDARHEGTSAAFVYVPDVDATCKLAKDAGFQVSEPEDMFWGDRMAHTVDPFGHHWKIATLKKQVSEEEIAEGAKAMAEKLS